MSVPSSLVGRNAPIPAQHVSRLPPGQPHQIPLLAALGKPARGKGVPKSVWMKTLDPGLSPPRLDDLLEAREGQASELSEPEVFQVGEGVSPPRAVVAVEGARGPLPEWRGARLATLAHDHRNTLIEVDVIEVKADDLRGPESAIPQHEDEGLVAALLEVRPFGHLEK